jgi:hypothetical protein
MKKRSFLRRDRFPPHDGRVSARVVGAGIGDARSVEPFELWSASGFMGCAERRAELSATYKESLWGGSSTVTPLTRWRPCT